MTYRHALSMLTALQLIAEEARGGPGGQKIGLSITPSSPDVGTFAIYRGQEARGEMAGELVLLVSAIARDVATASGLEVQDMPHHDPDLVWVALPVEQARVRLAAKALPSQQEPGGFSIGGSVAADALKAKAEQLSPRQQRELDALSWDLGDPKPNRATRRQRRRKRR